MHDGSPRLRLVPRRNLVPKVPLTIHETDRQNETVVDREDMLGPVFSSEIPVVTGNDFDSLLSAFGKRCNHLSDERVAPPIVKSALELADIVFPDAKQFAWTEDLFEEWVTKFPFEKQSRMRKALDNLHDVTLSRLSTKDLMVKSEVLLKRNDPTWAPRIIYIGSDEYNCLTGPLMNYFTKKLVAALDEFSCPEMEVRVAYGKSDTQIASFIAGPDPFNDNYVEGDFSANDREQVQDVREIFGYWLQKSGAPEWFVALYLKLAAKFKVRSRGFGLEAMIEHQLATGATDTTPRNTVWNICQWYSYCRARKLVRTSIVVLGDDILARIGRQMIDLQDWREWIAQARMILKAKHVRFFCEATFLSRFFVPGSTGPCMVPLLAKALARFNARANRNTSVSDEEYMAGKSLSYAFEFRHVVSMRQFFLERFASCQVDINDVATADLSWFTRQVCSTPQSLLKRIQEERCLLNDDAWLEVVMAKYDLGLFDMEQLCSSIILSTEQVFLTDERFRLLAGEIG